MLYEIVSSESLSLKCGDFKQTGVKTKENKKYRKVVLSSVVSPKQIILKTRTVIE